MVDLSEIYIRQLLAEYCSVADTASASNWLSSTSPSLRRRCRREAPQRGWAGGRGSFEVEEARQGSAGLLPQLWRRQASRKKDFGRRLFLKITSIIQAKKFIFVVKMLLSFLRSLSDSLIPWDKNLVSFYILSSLGETCKSETIRQGVTRCCVLHTHTHMHRKSLNGSFKSFP